MEIYLPKVKKKFKFFQYFSMVYTKPDMGMTNINFIFDQIHPCERKNSERSKKG